MIASGCALRSASDSTVDTLIIRNHTGHDMKEVALRVVETGAVIGCSSILKEREFFVGFPETENKRHAAYLVWLENGRQYTSRLASRHEINLEAHPDQPFVVVVDVYPHGRTEVNFD